MNNINLNQIEMNELPCSFLRWNRGLPRKLFFIFVNRVFHSWLLALLHVEAVIAGDGALPAFATPKFGELGVGPGMNEHISQNIRDFVELRQKLFNFVHIQLLFSDSGNKLIAIVGPEFAL